MRLPDGLGPRDGTGTSIDLDDLRDDDSDTAADQEAVDDTTETDSGSDPRVGGPTQGFNPGDSASNPSTDSDSSTDTSGSGTGGGSSSTDMSTDNDTTDTSSGPTRRRDRRGGRDRIAGSTGDSSDTDASNSASGSSSSTSSNDTGGRGGRDRVAGSDASRDGSDNSDESGAGQARNVVDSVLSGAQDAADRAADAAGDAADAARDAVDTATSSDPAQQAEEALNNLGQQLEQDAESAEQTADERAEQTPASPTGVVSGSGAVSEASGEALEALLKQGAGATQLPDAVAAGADEIEELVSATSVAGGSEEEFSEEVSDDIEGVQQIATATADQARSNPEDFAAGILTGAALGGGASTIARGSRLGRAVGEKSTSRADAAGQTGRQTVDAASDVPDDTAETLRALFSGESRAQLGPPGGPRGENVRSASEIFDDDGRDGGAADAVEADGDQLMKTREVETQRSRDSGARVTGDEVLSDDQLQELQREFGDGQRTSVDPETRSVTTAGAADPDGRTIGGGAIDDGGRAGATAGIVSGLGGAGGGQLGEGAIDGSGQPTDPEAGGVVPGAPADPETGIVNNVQPGGGPGEIGAPPGTTTPLPPETTTPTETITGTPIPDEPTPPFPPETTTPTETTTGTPIPDEPTQPPDTTTRQDQSESILPAAPDTTNRADDNADQRRPDPDLDFGRIRSDDDERQREGVDRDEQQQSPLSLLISTDTAETGVGDADDVLDDFF